MDKVAGPVRLEYKDDLLREYPVTYVPASFIMDKNGEISFSAIGVLKAEEIKAELDKVVSN